MFKFNKKRAFTLAEIMIVFTVIGILTAILIPALFNSSPNQQRLKARKAYNTLSRAVENLTNSGPYDTNDGLLDSTSFATEETDRNSFFCNNLAEILNVKSSYCMLEDDDGNSYDYANDGITNTNDSTCVKFTTSSSETRKYLCLTTNSDGTADYETLQDAFDTACESAYFDSGTASGNYNIETADGVLWGIQRTDFSNTSEITVNSVTSPSFYNLICIDVDNHSDSDHVYGAGIRKDGKILIGTKLQEIVTDEPDSVMESDD